jgi:hypothetical protein
MKFSDLLFNTELFELAYKRKEILNKCFDLSPQICKHIVKLCCFIIPIDVNGHLKSINVWLGDIEDLKLKSNSRLDYKSYYIEIWNKFIDSKEDLERIFNKLKSREYSDLPIREVDFNVLYAKLCVVMIDVSKDIENYDLKSFEYYLDKYKIEYK